MAAMRVEGGRPRMIPCGMSARVVAAWLKRSTEAKKSPA